MTTNAWDALERAIALAVSAHHGQRDKAGLPYILHLLRVMDAVDDPIKKQAAVLHDYLEDTSGSVESLHRHSINELAIQAIIRLTRVESSTYCEYIVALSVDPVATQVKLADLEDNYRIGRVAYRAEHRNEDVKRIQKYALSYQFLLRSIDEQEYRLRMEGVE